MTTNSKKIVFGILGAMLIALSIYLVPKFIDIKKTETVTQEEYVNQMMK